MPRLRTSYKYSQLWMLRALWAPLLPYRKDRYVGRFCTLSANGLSQSNNSACTNRGSVVSARTSSVVSSSNSSLVVAAAKKRVKLEREDLHRYTLEGEETSKERKSERRAQKGEGEPCNQMEPMCLWFSQEKSFIPLGKRSFRLPRSGKALDNKFALKSINHLVYLELMQARPLLGQQSAQLPIKFETMGLKRKQNYYFYETFALRSRQ